MGPTASGKTALALALAQATGAEIINADSMQVYRDLSVLTNRPDPEETALAPHRLFGHVDAAAPYSVGAWLADARAAIAAAGRLRRPVVVVGGTGLYFKALTEGIAPAPAAPETLRRELRDDLARLGVNALHARLASVDPALAQRLAPGDAPRILRALEVFCSSGRPLSELQQERAGGLPLGAWIGLRLDPPRQELRRTIEVRFAEMLRRGALEEAARLLQRNLDPTLPILKAHGLPWIFAYLRGELSLPQAMERAVADTRRYAKRQRTWMAHQMTAWTPIVAELLQDRVDLALEHWLAVDQPPALRNPGRQGENDA